MDELTEKMLEVQTRKPTDKASAASNVK